MGMRNATVTSVDEVLNTDLWKMYKMKRQKVAEELRNRWECTWAHQIAPKLTELHRKFDYITLEEGANEVLLLHGTTHENAQRIAKQGFDDRLTERGLYSPGVYLTPDSCKAAQYGSSGSTRCIIL